MARTLAQLESMNAAHADIAGANVVVGSLNSSKNQNQPVNLADVEEMYGDTMPQPIEIPAGQAGYRHKTSLSQGNWHPAGDRFGGAVIMAEMLGWHNSKVRASSSGEGYHFIEQEMQDPDSHRYKTLRDVLTVDYSPDVAHLFNQAWLSPAPNDCPTLGEWAGTLNKLVAGHTPGPEPGRQGPVIGRRPVGGVVSGVPSGAHPAPLVSGSASANPPAGAVARRPVGTAPSTPAAQQSEPQAGPTLPKPPQYQGSSQPHGSSVQRVAPGMTGAARSASVQMPPAPERVALNRPTVVTVMIAVHILFTIACVIGGLIVVFDGYTGDDWGLLIAVPLGVLYAIAARGLVNMREWARKITIVLLVMTALAGFAGLVGFLAIIPLVLLNKAEIKNQFT